MKTYQSILLILGSALTTSPAWSETLYVQAVKATLRAEPKTTAPAVVDVERGAMVEGGATQGFWRQVQVASKSGWVTKLALSTRPPVGRNTLETAAKISDKKASRERAKSELVSASARGLSTDASMQRKRGNQARYQEDRATVTRMDSYTINDAALETFVREGGLN